MYLPTDFEETDPQRIAALIEANPFGMLITTADGAPFVTHLPFLYEVADDTQGRLLGHVAKANPQWRHFAAGQEVLTVFQGPHAYVSPAWYASPGVPTWNYAVVHLRGRPRLIESAAALEALLERLTHAHEAAQTEPWKANLNGKRRDQLFNMIVGFEIEVTEIQAKFKLSQNRSVTDRQRVIQALSQSDRPTDHAVAQLMSALSKPIEP